MNNLALIISKSTKQLGNLVTIVSRTIFELKVLFLQRHPIYNDHDFLQETYSFSCPVLLFTFYPLLTFKPQPYLYESSSSSYHPVVLHHHHLHLIILPLKLQLAFLSFVWKQSFSCQLFLLHHCRSCQEDFSWFSLNFNQLRTFSSIVSWHQVSSIFKAWLNLLEIDLYQRYTLNQEHLHHLYLFLCRSSQKDWTPLFLYINFVYLAISIQQTYQPLTFVKQFWSFPNFA